MEKQKQDIETIHKDIINNLQAEMRIRKKIYNFQAQFPHMLSTLTALQEDKKHLDKLLSKVEAAIYIKI